MAAMTKAQQIANSIGQRRLANLLGVRPTAVNNAVKRGHFPPGWRKAIHEICDREGIEFSDDAFSWSHDVDWSAA